MKVLEKFFRFLSLPFSRVIFSSLLFVLSQPPFFLPSIWLGILALPSGAIYAYVSGFLFWVSILHWIPFSVLHGGFGLFFGILALILLSAILSLFFLPLALFERHPFISVLIFSIFEFMRYEIFPWAPSASSMWFFMPSGYPIFIFSFLALLPAVFFKYLLLGKRKRAFLFLPFFLFLFLPSRGREVRGISFAVLRGEIPRMEQWRDTIRAVRRFERFLLESPDADFVVFPELFLPYPFELWYSGVGGVRGRGRGREILEGLRKVVIFGGIWQGGYEGIGSRFWNVGVVWDGVKKVKVWDSGSGRFQSVQENLYIQGKEKLVPFGERVPFRNFLEGLFPFLFEREMMRGDFEEWEWGRKTFVFHLLLGGNEVGRGEGGEEEVRGEEEGEDVRGREVVDSGGGSMVGGEIVRGGDVGVVREMRFSEMLCWEVLFYASPLRWFSGLGWGWDVIFNITNDVWFGTSWGKEQHFWYSVLVARSLSATLVRSSNFGISGVYTVSGMYKLKDEGEGFLFFSF